jgi:hypothetical protein
MLYENLFVLRSEVNDALKNRQTGLKSSSC